MRCNIHRNITIQHNAKRNICIYINNQKIQKPVRCVHAHASFFLMNKRKWIIFILLFLLDIFCLSQIWYFRTYQTLMPFSSYFLFDNVSELLIKSIIGSIHPADIWVILPTILLLFLYLGFYKNNTEAYEPLPKRIAYGAMIFIICSFGYLATPLKAAIIKDPNRPSPWIRWTASFGPSFYVEANGLVPYFIYTIIKETTTSKKYTRRKNYIDRFILSKEKNKYTIRFLIIPEKI